jgi:xylulokinase
MAILATDAGTTALRDPLTRGAILGLMPQTSPGGLSRAVLEGIACALRHALGEMCSESQLPELIRLGGGGAQSDTWQGIIANVLGIPTERIAMADVSAFSAATNASRKMVPAGESHRATPNSGLVGRYQERYEIYRDALQAVTPISHRLASLANHEP